MKAQIAVLGAGNGAHAFAGALALSGHRVRLYNAFAGEIAGLKARGGVEVEGAIQGFGTLDLVTTDIEPVVAGADIVLVVVPATVHGFMAETCAPHLRDGQAVVLNPGRTGGALEFHAALRRAGSAARILLAEAQTLLYTCRISAPARVRVAEVKREVRLAAFPARDTTPVLARLNPLCRQFVAAADVLATGIENIGAVFHPAASILSAARIESGVPFEFYADLTPGVVRVMEAVDSERLAVAGALGVEAQSARDWLAQTYAGVAGETLCQRLRSCGAYRGIPAPRSLDTRYIWEDVPTGLVPLVALGRIAGIDMPACTGAVNLANALLGRDFWKEGRSAARLGLEGLDRDGLRDLVREGPEGRVQ